MWQRAVQGDLEAELQGFLRKQLETPRRAAGYGCCG